jgi:ClpP class serine protease
VEDEISGAQRFAPLALDAALNAAWAMEPEALSRLLDIAARQNEVSQEALEAYRAKTLAGADRAQIRGKTAIVNAIGPMFKRANLMTAISGATSYDIMRRDVQAAADSGVKNLVLNIDSPGGEASGVGELAQAVYALRDRMNIVAYISGAGASAAYWLASAAHTIVVDPTAILGSIGVQWAMVDTSRGRREKGRQALHVHFVAVADEKRRSGIGGRRFAHSSRGRRSSSSLRRRRRKISRRGD